MKDVKMRARVAVDNELAAISDAQNALKSLAFSWRVVERALLYLCVRSVSADRMPIFAQKLLDAAR